jgi:hypothetical protein
MEAARSFDPSIKLHGVTLPEYRNLNFYPRKNFGRFSDTHAPQHFFLMNTHTSSLHKTVETRFRTYKNR